MKTPHKHPPTKIRRPPIAITILILLALYIPNHLVQAQMEHNHDTDQGMEANTVNDRLMTDEINTMKGSITTIKSSASKGSFESVKSKVTAIKKSWASVKTELQLRHEDLSINRFEAAFKSFEESLKTENKSKLAKEAQRLSTAFDDVVTSLEKPEVDGFKLLTTLSYPVLAWFLLTLTVTEVVRVGKVRL